MKLPIWISNRHLHLSQADADALFGAGYEFQNLKDLSQPGQFACKETLSVKGPKWQIDGVRILGPLRKETQVEILKADTFKLGVDAPIRLSGHLEGTPGIELVGPQWSVTISHGLIVAERHLHATPADAEKLGVQDGQTIAVAVEGERALLFGRVTVRVTENSALDMHIDTEEANAAGLGLGAEGELIK